MAFTDSPPGNPFTYSRPCSTDTQGRLSRYKESGDLTLGMIPYQTTANHPRQKVILQLRVNAPLSAVPRAVFAHTLPNSPPPPPPPYLPTQTPRQLNVISSFESFKKVREMSRNLDVLPLNDSLHGFPVTLYSFHGIIPTFKEFLQNDSIWNKPLPPFKPKRKRRTPHAVEEIETEPKEEEEPLKKTDLVEEASTKVSLIKNNPDTNEIVPIAVGKEEAAEEPPSEFFESAPRIESADQSSSEVSSNPVKLKPCSVVLRKIEFSSKFFKSFNKRKRKNEKKERQKEKQCATISTADISDVVVIPDDDPIIEIPDDDDPPQSQSKENPAGRTSQEDSAECHSRLTAPTSNSPSLRPSKWNPDNSFTLDDEFIDKSCLTGCAKFVLYPSEHIKNQYHFSKRNKLGSKKRKECDDNEENLSNQNSPMSNKQINCKNVLHESTNEPNTLDPLVKLRKSIAIHNPDLNAILNEPLESENVSNKDSSSSRPAISKKSVSQWRVQIVSPSPDIPPLSDSSVPHNVNLVDCQLTLPNDSSRSGPSNVKSSSSNEHSAVSNEKVIRIKLINGKNPMPTN